MVAPTRKTALLVAVNLFAFVTAIPVLVPMGHTQEASRAANTSDGQRSQAVASGEVEPSSGQIKIAATVVGRIREVLVKTNDKVFAGELLIRLDDDEAQAQVTSAEAQAAVSKRMRNDESATGRAADRRKAEDSLADAEKAVVDARAIFDTAAAAKRFYGAPDGSLNTAQTALSRAQDRLKQQQAELRKIEAQANMPLPTQPEGKLKVSRAELSLAQAVLEKMMIRAPIAGTVLQVNAKAGELASPSSPQPLVVLGDVSALRVRAELDELDLGAIKIDQPVLVRAAAIRERGFAGKVSSIAPLVEPRRINSHGQRNLADTKVVEVFVDLDDAGPLTVGMKVDVYFRSETPQRQ
jgi:HlyD family secretion protein